MNRTRFGWLLIAGTVLAPIGGGLTGLAFSDGIGWLFLVGLAWFAAGVALLAGALGYERGQDTAIERLRRERRISP
jgi:hypothetical protein